MRKAFLFVLCFTFIQSYAQFSWNNRHSFMQGNNINTVLIADGVFNTDRNFTFNGIEAGLIWPVSATNRLTAIFGSGMWIGAKVGPQKELRVAGATYSSHYSPGNIPFMGQVPPISVCNDTAWKVYLVNLNDQSLVNGGQIFKTAGGRTYSFTYTSWSAWPIAKGAPYAEINGIPGYQPGWNGDRPGIGNGSKVRPEELCFMTYMDFTNCTNDTHSRQLPLPGGTLPLGVEVQHLTFMFRCPPLTNMYFVKCRLINKGLLNWDSTYVSFFNDVDVGNAFDDVVGCDSIRNLSFLYNKDNNDEGPGGYGTNPPACGSRFLQCPLIFTGNVNDTVKLPYDTLIRYKMVRMSGHATFVGGGGSCTGDPDHAINGYNWMRGKNGCGANLINWVTLQPTSFMYSGNSCTQTGWIDSVGRDRRNLQNTGPFVMNSGDTQVIVMAYVIARDGGNNFQNVCALQNWSDTALKHYYNNFTSCIPIGIQPISSEVPDRFALYQNYPNPFNPTTAIRFSIPPLEGARERTVILIYDLLGREVETLLNESIQPGKYEVEWNAENYPSGVYFYQLTSSGFNQTNKMVLLK